LRLNLTEIVTVTKLFKAKKYSTSKRELDFSNQMVKLEHLRLCLQKTKTLALLIQTRTGTSKKFHKCTSCKISPDFSTSNTGQNRTEQQVLKTISHAFFF